MAKTKVKPKEVVKDDFKARKEIVLSKCEQAGIFESYLNEIKNTKSNEELNNVLMSNVELRPFMED